MMGPAGMSDVRVERQVAVALGYRPGTDVAPRVLAKGEGSLAAEIVRVAREHNVPLREDRDLARVLAKIDTDSEIPPSLYPALAEVLAFIYRMNAAFAGNPGGGEEGTGS